MRFFYVLTLFLGSLSLNLFAQNSGSLTLNFEHLFNNEKLEIGNKYLNFHKEEVSFSTVNYFISNLSLVKKDGSVFVIPQDSSYFLIRHSAETEQKSFTLSDIPVGEYVGLNFMIGVDSLRSTMSIEHRGGNLDMGAAAKGMYWIWNSGYIFFKLEGSSSAAPEKFKHKFTYHIGGFGGYKTKTLNSIRTTSLKIPAVHIQEKKDEKLTVNVHIDRFFHGNYDLKIADKPNVMWGVDSEKIADNYKEAFEIK